MAFSSSEGKLFFKDWLIHMAKPLGFTKFFDIGCGAGGYGAIVREVFKQDAIVCGIDIFPEYIDRFSLRDIYTVVEVADIRDLHLLIPPFDLIIMGDVIEHLSKRDAVGIVNSLRYKCRFLWAALPVKIARSWSTGYLQPECDYAENPANKHLHDWTGEEIISEFKPLWFVPFIQVGVFLVEGKE